MSVELPRWRGDTVLSEALNTLASAIETVSRKKIVAGPNLSFVEDDHGILLDGVGSSGGSSGYFPWDIIAVPDPDASDPEKAPTLVTIQPGLFANFLASNWDQEWKVPYGDNSLYFAKVEIATDGKVITGVTIKFDKTELKRENPEKYAVEPKQQYLFGMFKAGATYRTTDPYIGNIYQRPIRYMVTINDKNPFVPYDIWYHIG